MKYLKRIFESRYDTYNSELSEVNDLQDFCEMYLAYLIDDDFKVNVSRTEFGTFKKSFSIVIESELPVSWDQIKDKLIPFLEMLKKNYNFGVYPEQRFKFHESWLDKSIMFDLEGRTDKIDIDELIEDKPTYGYPRPGKYLRGITKMGITVHPKDLNESRHEILTNPKRFTFEFQEELKDFCETHLAYLVDDGYSIRVATNTTSLKRFDEENDNQIYASLVDCDEQIVDTIDDPRNFNWDNIKNSFIPFIQHLSKQYNIGRIYMYGYPSTTSECMSYTYTVQKILDDDNIVPVIYSIFLRID
jgi:regulator of sigma D